MAGVEGKRIKTPLARPNSSDRRRRVVGVLEEQARSLARVSEYYAAALQADAGFTGVLSHNPMSRA